MSELKPCPFCGSEARAANEEYVFCVGCDALITGASAITSWNMRAERTCHIVEAACKIVLSDGTELFESGCSECNSYLDIGDNYCSNCGAKVVKSVENSD